MRLDHFFNRLDWRFDGLYERYERQEGEVRRLREEVQEMKVCCRRPASQPSCAIMPADWAT